MPQPSATHVPPQNIEAEESVLGAMLVAEPALTRVIDEVKLLAEDFYLEKHALIFACARDLYAASKPVDELSVKAALVARGKIHDAQGKPRPAIDVAGGPHYISELAAKVPAAGNAKHYAEIVQQNSLLRRLLGAGQEIQGWVHERDGEPRELSERAEKLLFDITHKAGAGSDSSGSPRSALAASEVDLVERIREGVPEREFVPGCKDWAIRGKRYLMPAPAGTGKSLAAAVISTDVIEAGGTVAIFDVEMGADEYARRFADVFGARDSDSSLETACGERLRYYNWPHLRVTWGPEEWAESLQGVDLAIFDSSRLMLSAAGLAEDSNDDYATFVNSLIVPLARAGVMTLVLDNTGHEERERARGASAKADLNEVVYVAKVGEEFDRDRSGHLRLVLRRTRFADLPGELHIPVGGGTYGPVVEAEPAADSSGFRPTTLMERIAEAIEQEPGVTKSDIRRAVSGKSDAKDLALRLLVDDGWVSVRPDGQARRHHNVTLYRASEDPKAPPSNA